MGISGYSHEAHARYLDFDIRFWYLAGYDYVTVELQVPMMRQWLTAGDTALLASAERRWQSENSGAIQSWSDFERYPWPKPEDVDFFNLEYVSRHLPEGMQIIFCTQGGPMENLVTLMGLTPLALAVHDAPDLVAAIAERLSEVRETIYAAAVDVPNVGAFWMGDDLGYKTSTVLSPRDLRKYVFPYQKRIVDIAHAHDKPFLLHACGNLARIMDELIDGVGIDAKHSFEDVIMPVAEFKQRWVAAWPCWAGSIWISFAGTACRRSVPIRARSSKRARPAAAMRWEPAIHQPTMYPLRTISPCSMKARDTRGEATPTMSPHRTSGKGALNGRFQSQTTGRLLRWWTPRTGAYSTESAARRRYESLVANALNTS